MGESSQLILDVEQDIKVDENLFKILKPHQKEGVAFMWNALFKEKHGCILAHCMGLGKYRIFIIKCFETRIYLFYSHMKFEIKKSSIRSSHKYLSFLYFLIRIFFHFR